MVLIRIRAIDEEPGGCDGCQTSLVDRGHFVDARMIARDACGVPRRGEIDMNHAEEGVGIDSAKGRTILIMEDEPSLAEGLKMVLSEQGYRVSVAEAGLRALGSLAERDYDLLVMDLRLPDMDGMEVLRLIKETKPETAVIVMTGYATVASAMESMKLGALDYLPKPFTEDEFKAAVEKALTVKKEVFSENK